MKLDELAELAGVSRTTVSYVVNGKAKQYRVSDKTIEKVQALITKYDFKPNIMAAGLRAGKTNTIGLIIPDFENSSYAKIANQLEQSCREKGYQLLMACSNDNENNELDCAKHFLQRQVDALVVSTALSAQNDFYQHCNVPIIGFDRRLDAAGQDNVLTDDLDDAYRLACALSSKKSVKRVLFLGALAHLPISRAREQGFQKAIEDQQLQVDLLYASQFRKESAAQAFTQWLQDNSLPDAIFSTSFTLLQGVLQVFLLQQRAIPKELVIATFGQNEILDLLENDVVCSVQDHQQIVRSLLNLALYKTEGKKQKSQAVIPRKLRFYHWN